MRISDVDWELNRQRTGRRPRAVGALIALAIAACCSYALVVAEKERRNATKQLDEAATQLNLVRQARLKTQPTAQVATPSDALNAAELLQSDWPERMTEVEHCVVEPARLVRLQLQGGTQSSSAYLDVPPGSELQKVLGCLNAGATVGTWSVAELKGSNLAADGANRQSTAGSGNVHFLWNRKWVQHQ